MKKITERKVSTTKYIAIRLNIFKILIFNTLEVFFHLFLEDYMKMVILIFRRFCSELKIIFNKKFKKKRAIFNVLYLTHKWSTF